MRQNTRGRNKLLNFLKGETHKGITWTKGYETIDGKKNLAAQQGSYELSGLDGHISDPIVLEEGNRRYTFKNVVPKNNDEAVARELEIEQL